jgi:AraC-like DNA-binding protein/mannose-6-phosphate isomerase-like protein (cupin superfamily)
MDEMVNQLYKMTVARTADFFTYLASKPRDGWGLELTTVGHQHVAPRSQYPPAGHPKSHAFGWKRGRKLDEYHLIYIPGGAGCFETRREILDVLAGDLVLIDKGDWHRYRPNEKTGWEAYWVGFKGTYFEKHICGDVLKQRKSTLRSLGYRPELIDIFDQLINLSRREAPIFKTVSLGLLCQILRYPTAPSKVKTADQSVADLAVAFIRRNLFSTVDFHELASSLGLSYSRFRFVFKSTTGIAPHQFLLKERIACAKRLLKNPAVEIKTVGYKAGFRSSSYFSRVFRRKTGVTPSAQRAHRN